MSTRTNLITSILCAFSLALTACGDGMSASRAGSCGGGVLNGVLSDVVVNEIPLTVDQGMSLAGTRARVWIPKGGVVPGSSGLVFVTGVDGGFIEPVDGIYRRLAWIFAERGYPSIFVRYRYPGDLEESVKDGMAAVTKLRSLGVRNIGLVGWSFGGAVVSHLAVQAKGVRTIVGFAPQGKDTEPVAGLKEDQSLLLFHSLADENVPYSSSEFIYSEAPETIRKELRTFEEADHYLSGESQRVLPAVTRWLEQELPPCL